MKGAKGAQCYYSLAFGVSSAVSRVLVSFPVPLFIAFWPVELKACKQQGSESEVLLSEKSLVVCGLTFMGNLSVADDFLA